jgi:cyclopropane fatty-acyl-phospholipid synthase-like methyltransferase
MALLSIAAAPMAMQLPAAPYEETPPEVVERMLQLAELRPGDVVDDLGCGDGRIVIAAVRRRDVRGVCVELDAARLKWAREMAAKAGVAMGTPPRGLYRWTIPQPR